MRIVNLFLKFPFATLVFLVFFSLQIFSTFLLKIDHFEMEWELFYFTKDDFLQNMF